MDQEKDLTNKETSLQTENLEEQSNEENNQELRLQEIEITMQELDISIEQLEMSLEENADNEEKLEQLQKMYEQYDTLRQEKKQILKAKKTSWDKIPVWIIVYAVIQGILLMPFISYYIWMAFGDWIIEIFKEVFLSFARSDAKFVFNLVLLLTIYSLPIIDFLVTWTLYVNVVKKEFEKKIFKWIWIIQSVLTVGLGIYLYFSVIKGNII